MTIKLIGDKLVLSEAPARDIEGALIVIDKIGRFKYVDVKRLEKEYTLPDQNTSEDIDMVYLRVI